MKQILFLFQRAYRWTGQFPDDRGLRNPPVRRRNSLNGKLPETRASASLCALRAEGGSRPGRGCAHSAERGGRRALRIRRAAASVIVGLAGAAALATPTAAQATADAPQEPEISQPLTAAVVGTPEAHDGQRVFKLRIQFSRDIATSYKDLKKHGVSISGGRIKGVNRVHRRNDLWNFNIRPTSDGPLTITLAGGRACGEAGAVCTSDGARLANTLVHTVPGPASAALRAAPASRTVRQSTSTIGIAAEHEEILAQLENLVFILTRTGDTASALEVTVNLTQDRQWLSAERLTHNVTFAAGQSSVILRLHRANFAAADQSSGDLTATVAPVDGYDVSGASATARVISQPGPLFTVQFAKNAYAFAEGAGAAQVEAVVTATLQIPRPVDVSLTLVSIGHDAETHPDLSAASPGDYMAVSERFAVRAAQFTLENGRMVARAAVDLAIVDDNDVEGAERFALALIRDASNQGRIGLLDATGELCDCTSTPYPVTIIDNDTPAWTVTKSAATLEETADSEVVVTVGTGGVLYPQDRTIGIAFSGSATAGIDYTVEDADGEPLGAPYELALRAGQSEVAFKLRGVADTDSEGDESIGVQASYDGKDIDTLRAITLVDTQETVSGLTVEGLEAHRPSGAPWYAADGRFRLCWTPEDVELSELSDFDYGFLLYFVEEGSAWPDSSDGAFHAPSVRDAGGSRPSVSPCNGGRGVGFTASHALLDPDMTFYFRMTARRGSQTVASNVVSARSVNSNAPLTARIIASGFPAKTAGGRYVLDVPDPVRGAFEVAVTFSSWPKGWHYADAVTGLALDDFEVTAATLSWPDGTPTYETHVGYRLKVTPTTPGTDVTVAVKADAVTVGTKSNTASDTFRRGTAMEGSSEAALSVADARAREGKHPTIAFTVSLDRPATGPVTVDYATQDGSARAGEDFRGVTGTLGFGPGETRRTVSVTVLDDAIDEGEETFTLVLSNAAGAFIADGTATGTIANSDPMPKAWVARFGRTVAEQVLDAVEARMRAPRTPGIEATLAGRRIASRPGVAADFGSGRLTAEQSLSDRLRHDGNRERRRGFGSRTVTETDLLAGSSFALTAGEPQTGRYALWGRGAATRFDGADGDLALDGEVVSGMLGADWTRDAVMAGLVVAHSRGEGGYRVAPSGDPGSESGASGMVSSTLTGLYPWGRYAVSERVSIWGVAGYGAGTLTLTPEGADGIARAAIRTDLDLLMAAAGLRGVLARAPESGGIDLAVKTDVMGVWTTAAAARGEAGNLAAAKARVSRLRLGLEGSRPFRFEDMATLTPSVEIGMRHDGGDADTGSGLDVAAGIAWSDSRRGLSAGFRGRALLSHDAKGFRQRGIAGTLSWNPTPGGRGPEFALERTVGVQASGGMDRLFERPTLIGLAADRNDLQHGRFEARFGYGLGAFGGRFTMTPEVGVNVSDAGRGYSLGWRLSHEGIGAGSLELDFEARRRENANNGADPEHAVGFRLTARF